MFKKKSPPPITKGIQCKRFECSKSGFVTVGRDRKMIEQAQGEAIQWMSANDDLDIISIDTACAGMLTVVTVWFRL